MHTWEQAELALKETPGLALAVRVAMIGRKTVAEMTALRQATSLFHSFCAASTSYGGC